MKQFIAWLMALLMSTFNNVEFVPAEDTDYVGNIYYKIEVGQEPDYRNVYSYTNPASSTVSCRTANYSSNGKFVDYGDITPKRKGMWFADGTSMSISDIPKDSKKFEFKDVSTCLIIAPYDCTLETPSDTSDGTAMILRCNIGDKSYRLTINNMYGWYCDAAKTNQNDADGNYQTVHTYREKAGEHSFKQGDVVGTATKGTTITVVELEGDKVPKEGNSPSLYKFFTQGD